MVPDDGQTLHLCCVQIPEHFAEAVRRAGSIFLKTYQRMDREVDADFFFFL